MCAAFTRSPRKIAGALCSLFFASTIALPDAGGAPADDCLDAAPFARVVTSDPNRTDGARSARDETYRAEDVLLETELPQNADGCYRVPVGSDDLVSVGLQWLETRTFTSLRIRFASLPVPPAEDARVEYWDGLTLWQGAWKPLKGRIAQQGDALVFTVSEAHPRTRKIRWILSAADGPIVVKQFEAVTPCPLRTATIRLEAVQSCAHPVADIDLYNGRIVTSQPKLAFGSWQIATPLTIQIRCIDPEDPACVATDRTLIRYRAGQRAFSIAVDDILHRGPVWVPHAGLYACNAEAYEPFEDYRNRTASQQTILQRVRAMDDQTREQAMRVTHANPRLDEGPIMLALACDNDKFVVQRDGTVRFLKNFTQDMGPATTRYVVTPTFGTSRILSIVQDWGVPGINAAAHGGGAHQTIPLQIKDRRYARGLGHHANGQVVISLAGDFSRFEAEVGVQWAGGHGTGSVTFEVLADGTSVFQSGVMRENDAAVPVRVPVADVQTLTLKVTDAGDGIAYDGANWAEARLVPADPDASPVGVAEMFRAARHVERYLEDGWLPAPVVTHADEGVHYTQRTYVVPFARENLSTAPQWLNAEPLGVAEFTLANTTAERRLGRVLLTFSHLPEGGPLTIDRVAPHRVRIHRDGLLLAVLDHSGLSAREAMVTLRNEGIALDCTLEGNQKATFDVFLPAWLPGADAHAALVGGPTLFERFKQYWHAIMADAAQIELPDRWLSDVIRANQVHILLAARNEDAGRRVAPWIAADRYVTAIDSEGSSVVRGMQALGHDEFARRSFEYFFSKYQPDGSMTTGYTLMGGGWHLWTLGEFVRLSDDRAWFAQVADKPARLARWAVNELAKTRYRRPDGSKLPEFGLMTPGVLADWQNYAYYFYANGYYVAGLDAIGRALRAVGHPDAPRFLAESAQLREETLRAYRWSQARAPVVGLRDGTWVPYSPASVHTPGPIGDFFPGQDANRSWAYDVELGSHHLVPQGVVDPHAPEAGWMINQLEDVYFLYDGWGAYPAADSEQDPFNFGGFAKMQPYYCRIAEVYAMRDEVQPFIRTYFNTLASLIDGEVLSIYEHFANWVHNKTHETGYFLHQSRTMLVHERGDELWLAPFVTNRWLADGMTIRVADAPTFFGPVGYEIVSRADSRVIEATIDPPTRTRPQAIVLRLRHPEGKPIRSVEVNGRSHDDFDADRDCIRLVPSDSPIVVRASY